MGHCVEKIEDFADFLPTESEFCEKYHLSAKLRSERLRELKGILCGAHLAAIYGLNMDARLEAGWDLVLKVGCEHVTLILIR